MVSILPIAGAVGRVAVLAVLLAVGGPVFLWLPTVCHACLLGHRGGDGSPVREEEEEREEERRSGSTTKR